MGAAGSSYQRTGFDGRLGDAISRLIIEGAIAEQVIGRRQRIDEALRKGWRGTAHSIQGCHN